MNVSAPKILLGPVHRPARRSRPAPQVPHRRSRTPKASRTAKPSRTGMTSCWRHSSFPRKRESMFKRHLIFELDDLPIIAPRCIVMNKPRRYFLMPDFDLIEPDRVIMTMYGGVVDLTYCRLLIQSTDLSLDDVMALDQAQNGAFYFKLLMDYLEKF